MKTISRYIMTLALLLTAASGAWAQATFGVKEITPDMVPDSWNGDNSAVTADDLAKWGFKEVTEAEAKTWTGAPQQVTARLIYTISSGCESLDWEGGVQNGSSSYIRHNTIYLLVRNPDYSSQYDFFITTEPTTEETTNAEAPIEVTTNAASEGATFTEASFQMPAFDATAEYELVRDMSYQVIPVIADRIRIKKDGTTYVPVTATELVPVITDALDEQNPVIMVLYDETDKTGDYTVKLQKKVEGETPSWADATALSVGTFRYVITGAGLYDGEITTAEFQLFEGYEVTIPAGEYITYYRDEPLKLDDNETNAELYTISAVGTETATLSGPYDAMKALTPMLVHNKNTEEAKTILLIPCNEPDLALTVAPEFKGTLEATTIAASDASTNNYAFNGKQFVWVKNAVEIGANKAWLSVNTGVPSARGITLVFDETTKIANTNITNLTNGNWYDLNGRKLQNIPTKKGVYIFNGRKVVIK